MQRQRRKVKMNQLEENSQPNCTNLRLIMMYHLRNEEETERVVQGDLVIVRGESKGSSLNQCPRDPETTVGREGGSTESV